MRCAVVIDGVVSNLIVADPVTDQVPVGVLVAVPDGVWCDIGFYWDGAVFIDPNPPIGQGE